MLTFTNTLTHTKEKFKPLQDGKATMYNCGPTVYNYAHIGNLRAYVFADTLRRALELNGYKVTQVVNITDIGHLSGDADDGEDKMMKGLKREGKPFTLEAMKELANFYADRFVDDLHSLNITIPDVMPKASEHIPEEIALIKKLEENGFTYKTSDGVYFDTAKDKNYGKLGGLSENSDHARITINSEKHNPRDFALWKFATGTIGFESPWGKGFPGWHIECSAMAMKYLGETLDIHTGGVDHVSVHHNNEIAQSENATGKPFVRYWLHNAFIVVPGGKMAKSEGNTARLQDIIDKGISPLAYRYWLLTAHYSTPATFSWEALSGADQAYKRLTGKIQEIKETGGVVHSGYLKKFTEYIDDDLNTAQALALVWEIMNDSTLSDADKKATILECDKTLGLNLVITSNTKDIEVPEEVTKLATERDELRKKKDWTGADALRVKINQAGFEVKDSSTGFSLIKL